MKITKLMLSALVAAAALVSCNKEDLTPETIGLKTVKISLENAIMTKGPAGDKINANDPVQVNNIKIFLTNDNFTNSYPAHDLEGNEVSTYFSSLPTSPAAFHFISDKCSKVLVVANCDDPDLTLDDVKEMQAVGIGTQQDQTDLILIGSSGLTRVANDPNTPEDESVHTNTSGKYTEVYEADVTVCPIISRFEIDGFAIKFQKNIYSSIAITDVGFQHYFKNSYYTNGGFVPVSSNGANDIYAPLADLENKVAVFEWFNDAANKNVWYRDAVTGVTLTPTDNVKVIDNKFAYHFYPGNIIPTMMIKLVGNGDQPAYVYTTNYKLSNGDPLLRLEAGMIYRMNSASGEGVVEIPDNFDPIQRCINVSVSAERWAVTLITPDFGSGATQNN